MGQTAEELRTDIEERRRNMSGTVDAIEDRVMPGRIIDRRKRATRQWWHDTRDRVMGTSSDTAERAKGRMQDMAEDVEQMAGKVTDAPAQLAEQTRGAPLIAGGIAFGVGALLAIVIPETDPERRAGEAIAPQLSAATDAVKDVGQQALETAKGAAQEAVGELKDSAGEHAGQVADEAKDAGREVAGEAKHAGAQATGASDGGPSGS
jgi:gas vesicle protein